MTAQAALVVWNDVEAAYEADFNDWYTTEHLSERLAVPGFRTGRRYRAIADGPRYLAYYELDDLTVLKSEAYLRRLDNPTPRTRRIMPRFVGMHRSACRLRAGSGAVDGNRALLVEVFPSLTDSLTLEHWVVDRLLIALAAEPGVSAVHFWQTDPAASRTDTSESALRTAPDRMAEWIIFVYAADDAALTGAVERLKQALTSAPADSAVGPPRRYRLLQAVSAQS